ncbi:tetratricopeptide repeat-containing sensor histidine kinase [Robertkochia aurantiaca]|uniref:tetratricopeptide repeat-containing sensor histidine kinase n=1 Tax=Robertkochia aurantiaca TaxID=2873700 RepID=UPI001CC92FF6|nr:HAMP domain-containing sensor histidine kinase [Robertkochia sp. 3YJGBD-33]
MKLFYIYIALLLSLTPVAYGQAEVRDSLLYEIEQYQRKSSSRVIRDTNYINLLGKYMALHIYVDKDTVKKYAEKMISTSEITGYFRGSLYGLMGLSTYYQESGNIGEAVRLLKKALTKAERQGDDEYIICANYELARIYSESGDIKSAVTHCLQAIRMAENFENPDDDIRGLLAISHDNLAANFFILKQYKRALEEYEKAISLHEQISDQTGMAMSQSNAAETLLYLGEYRSSAQKLDEAIEFFRSSAYHNDWLAFAWRIKGDLFLEQKMIDSSKAAYAKARNLHESKVRDLRELMFLYNGMSKAEKKAGNLESSLDLANTSLSTAYGISSAEGIKNASETLYDLHKELGNDEKALEYLEIHKQYTDSIFNHENSKSLAAMQAEMEFQEKQKEIKFENEQEINEKNMLIYLSSGGVLILLTILFLTQRNRKLERKLNSLLAKKNSVLQLREMQLQRSNQTKDKLFSIISHDLRAPIASLNGMIDLFKDKQIDTQEFLEHAPQLSEQVKNVNFTLNNLLKWSQQQFNGTRTKPSKNNLFVLSNESTDLLRDYAAKKDLQIINNIPDDAFINGDTQQITILFRNLLSNAIKFTPKGGKIVLNAIEKDGGWQVEVKDTGVGMPKEKVDRIMSKESFIDSTYGTENEKGTGIGVNVCKEMVRANKGKFWVTSTPGKGSSFFFSLPKFSDDIAKAG